MDITAAVTAAQGAEFELQTVQLGEPSADEVLIRVVASGVCHTDAVARDLAIAPLPAVLGHEGSGIIEAIGSNVHGLEIGDHVVLSFAHCGECEMCLSGHPTSCLQFNPLNFGGCNHDHTHRIHQHGKPLSTFFGQSSFGTYAVAHQRNAVKVDKDVDLALLGPLGCGIQTGAGTVLNRLKPEFGSAIVIYGAGAVGLSALMAAKIMNCKHIIAVDIHDNRLEMAKQLGATAVINGKTEADVVAKIKAITGGGSHYAVETTGVPSVVTQALQALRPLGTCAIVGITPKMEIDVFADIMAEGKSMIGVIEGDAIAKVFIPNLVDYYKKGLFPFDKLVQFFEFDQINEAFAASANGSVIKPILRIGK